MPIISKETWDNLIPEEEKKEIINLFNNNESLKDVTSPDLYIVAAGLYDIIFGKENLQPQPLTYSAIIKELFKDGAWQVAGREYPREFIFNDDANDHYFLNCTSEQQGNKLLAINRILNVAKFLNKGWMPDWENNEEPKWYLCDFPGKRPIPAFTAQNNSCIVYFRTEELAKQAIQILGEDTVRLALTTEY